MRYKREEGFRYKFGIPLDIEMKLVTDLEVEIKFEGELMDLSPEGAKVVSEIDIPEDYQNIELTFELNGNKYVVKSYIVWRKQLGSHFSYGLNHVLSEELQRELIDAIKVHARNS